RGNTLRFSSRAFAFRNDSRSNIPGGENAIARSNKVFLFSGKEQLPRTTAWVFQPYSNTSARLRDFPQANKSSQEIPVHKSCAGPAEVLAADPAWQHGSRPACIPLPRALSEIAHRVDFFLPPLRRLRELLSNVQDG